jgi:hypothetical protein
MYALVVVLYHYFMLTPLLDGQCERFSNVLRVLLYAPLPALVIIPAGREYVLSHRPDWLVVIAFKVPEGLRPFRAWDIQN